MPLIVVYFACSGCALVGLVIGGWCRTSKQIEIWDEGYGRGFGDGKSAERCRCRRDIYKARDGGFADGYAKGKLDTEDAIPQIVMEG